MADNIYCESSDIERIAQKALSQRNAQPQDKESFSRSVDALNASLKADQLNVSLSDTLNKEK